VSQKVVDRRVKKGRRMNIIEGFLVGVTIGLSIVGFSFYVGTIEFKGGVDHDLFYSGRESTEGIKGIDDDLTRELLFEDGVNYKVSPKKVIIEIIRKCKD